MDFKDLSELDPYKLLMHLMSTGVLIGEQFCPKCKIKMSLSKKASVPENYAWRCWKCKSSYSVKHGSFFEGFKIPIIKILEVIDYWSKERKQIDMESSIQISRPVLIKICHFLRQLIVLDLDKENLQIGGPGEIVEIDESVFNKVKYNKGKDLVHYKKEKQIWIFGMKQISTGKCVFQVIIFFLAIKYIH